MFCPRCGKETTDNAAFCAGAGVIDIVLGGFSGVWIIMIVALQIVMVGMPTHIVLIELAVAAMGLLAAVGGIFALRRRYWGIALAGSILLVLPSGLLGIAAVVPTVMAKDEFGRRSTMQ